MSDSPTYARRLGLFSGTMAVIGGIIGSGIFLNPAVVAGRVATTPLTLLAWSLGGVVALLGAFIFGELAARLPRVGGGYAYLREAFGPLPAFLYAWALLLMIATGAIAAVAFTFASYAGALLGLSPAALPWVAVLAIVALSGLNYVGVKPAAWTLNVLTLLKLAALAALILVGLFFPVSDSSLAQYPAAALTAPQGFGPITLALAAAFVPVLFSYGGWQQTNFIAEELIEPERNLPKALVFGVLGVIVVYLLANLAYLRVLGVERLAGSAAPAADAMTALLGTRGRVLISIGILISTFGFLDLVIMVSPRVYQAMAADGLFFRSFAGLHPRYRTPAVAIVAQGVWASILIATRTYGQLLDYVTFADWIFFGLSVAALFVYRRRIPLAARAPGTFATPGYPVLPALFVVAAAYVVISVAWSSPGRTALGAVLLASGIPAYLIWKGRA